MRDKVNSGEYTPKRHFPNTPNYGSQRSARASSSKSSQGGHTSTAEVQREEDGATAPASQTPVSLTEAIDPCVALRPRRQSGDTLNPARSFRAPSETRVLIICDFHGVLDTLEYLRRHRGRREETEGTIVQENQTAVLRILQEPHHQVGVLSYVGARSTQLRDQVTRAVRDVNRFLEERGRTKQVGLSICDRPEDKAFVVQSSRAAAFVDDKYICWWVTGRSEPRPAVVEGNFRHSLKLDLFSKAFMDSSSPEFSLSHLWREVGALHPLGLG